MICAYVGHLIAAETCFLVVRVHMELTGQWDVVFEPKAMPPQDTGRNKSSIAAEQKQLLVFKAAELQGTPAEYQKKASTYQSEVQKSTVREAKPVLRYETQNGTPVDTKPRGQQQQAQRASFRPPQPLPAADSTPQQALPASFRPQQPLPAADSKPQQAKPASFRPPQPLPAADSKPQQPKPARFRPPQPLPAAGSKSQQALPLEAEQKALSSPSTSVRREVGGFTALRASLQNLHESTVV